jgi:hypothetical protein
MNCWHCDRPAHGVCRFCGRGVCRDHAQSMPHITDVYHTQKGEYRALVVGDTLYCGVCQPQEDPVKIEGLE